MSQEPTIARGWTIEGFRSFWAKPDISLIPAFTRLPATSWVISRGRSAWSTIPSLASVPTSP